MQTIPRMLAVSLLFLSCRKDITSESLLSPVQEVEVASDAVQQKTIFGLFPSGIFRAEQRLKMAKKLGVTYLRTRISLDEYLEESKYLNKLSPDCQMLLTVSSGLNGEPFPTDLTAYKEKLRTILRLCKKPKYLVIENEEAIQSNHSGTLRDYKRELAAAVAVGKEFNVKVTNGGLLFAGVIFLTYQDYLKNNQIKKAKSFAARAVNPKIINKDGLIKPSNLQRENILECDELLGYYKNLDIAAVNLHIYYPIFQQTLALQPGVIKEVCDYVKRRTGKPVISNEVGQKDQKTATTKILLKEIQKSGMKFCMWFGADGGHGAYGLYDKDLRLRKTGQIFRDFVANQNN